MSNLTNFIKENITYEVLYEKQDYINLFKKYSVGKFREAGTDMHFYYTDVEYEKHLTLINTVLNREYTFKFNNKIPFNIAEVNVIEIENIISVTISFLREDIEKNKYILEKYYTNELLKKNKEDS